MKKSSRIVLGVAMLGLVSALTLCDESPEQRRCVDNTGKVVADDLCRVKEAQPYSGAGSGAGGTHTFFWYYGGTGGTSPGSVAAGGSFTSAHSSTGGRSSASHGGSVGRGGFGGSAAAHGGASGA
jgi:hypothetical protein